MIRLGIAGACGRMGQRIGTLAAADKHLKIAGALERAKHPLLGRDYGSVIGAGNLGIPVQDEVGKVVARVDVLVDFALGDAIAEHLAAAKKAKKALVIGTTGLNGSLGEKIREASRWIACVMSPNMSPGVNVLLEFVGEVAKALGDGYDIEIVETHHRMKKDAPSGTALALAQAIARATKREISQDGRARVGPTDKKIVIHALRGGDIVGDHVVVYAGNGEMLQISHRATSRDTFAAGALRAAAFAATAKPGLYTMRDVMRNS